MTAKLGRKEYKRRVPVDNYSFKYDKSRECFALALRDRTYAFDPKAPPGLYLVNISVAANKSWRLRECIIEEVAHAVSLVGDSHSSIVEHSIFNSNPDAPAYIELTQNDRYMLRILFDPRIKRGMTRYELERTAGLIFDELVADSATR